MKKAIALLLMMVLALCVSIAGAEATKDFLGKTVPGFYGDGQRRENLYPERGAEGP